MKKKKTLALLGCSSALLLTGIAISKDYDKNTNNEIPQVNATEYVQIANNEINELNSVIFQQESLLSEKDSLINALTASFDELLLIQAELGSQLDSCLFHSKYYINEMGHLITK